MSELSYLILSVITTHYASMPLSAQTYQNVCAVCADERYEYRGEDTHEQSSIFKGNGHGQNTSAKRGLQ